MLKNKKIKKNIKREDVTLFVCPWKAWKTLGRDKSTQPYASVGFHEIHCICYVIPLTLQPVSRFNTLIYVHVFPPSLNIT